MNTKMIFLLICVTLSIKMNPAYSLSYDDIKSLGADCPPYDTCSETRTLREDDILKQNCECKPSCVRYGTCCIDSPYNLQLSNNSGIGSLLTQPETCELIQESDFTLRTIFMQTKCKRNWEHDQRTQNLCENVLQRQTDPVSNTHVTSLVTNTTYKNYFCAVCNDDISDLIFWEIGLGFNPRLNLGKRNSPQEGIAQNLIYDNFSDQWGITVGMKDGEYFLPQDISGERRMEEESVLPVTIRFKYPHSLRDLTKECVPNLISGCHPDWKDSEIESKCHSYTAMVYTGEINFDNNDFKIHERSRNVHCAICNFLEDKFFFCNDTSVPLLPEEMPFDIFFNVNPSAGDRTGKLIQCPKGESYDPFFKKCFPNACVRVGYVIRNGKCVPP